MGELILLSECIRETVSLTLAYGCHVSTSLLLQITKIISNLSSSLKVDYLISVIYLTLFSLSDKPDKVIQDFSYFVVK